MKCPACHSPMFVIEYDGLELDHCAECAGTWFDADELGLLFADADGRPHAELAVDDFLARPDAATDEKPRRCPACRRAMRKVNIGPGGRVLVDVCGRGHGLYCDRGEVADLAVALADGSALDPDQPPARVMTFLGGMIGRGGAATD
jgi:Zn-finger nucleic acid-binding protein